jgi:glutathione S-transferase
MEQFRTEHREAFPLDEDVPPIGFPDMGNGHFAKKLSYKDWYEFNNAQRVHYNFLESLPLVLITIFISALKQPLAALILACIYFFSRLIYSIGYMVGGPNMRLIGGTP